MSSLMPNSDKEKINMELLEQTLTKDGWTQNAVEYILDAVRTHKYVVEAIDVIKKERGISL